MSLTIQTSVLSKPILGYPKKLQLPSTGKENKMAKKTIDPSTFLFRDTTVEKFLKNMDAKNKPGKKREKTFEGPFGTGFKTKKPKTTA